MLMMPTMNEIHSIKNPMEKFTLFAREKLHNTSKLNLQSLTNLVELPQNYYAYLRDDTIPKEYYWTFQQTVENNGFEFE